MPLDGFNILKELELNSTTTVNISNTLRAQADIRILEVLKFVGLLSWSYSDNSTDKIVDASTYTAFRDRLGYDDKSQTKLYGSITQNRGKRSSYVARGHFAWNQSFGRHTLNVIAGAELRGSDSNTVYSKLHGNPPLCHLPCRLAACHACAYDDNLIHLHSQHSLSPWQPFHAAFPIPYLSGG